MESLLPTLDGDVPADCHIYAGANGSIGIIVGITKSKYRLLKKLETELVKVFCEIESWTTRSPSMACIQNRSA